MMTKQEAFNKVWKHFIVDKNPPSHDGNGKCKYRGPNGERCAIGVLIPDEKYTPTMEGYTAIVIMDDFGLNLGLSMNFSEDLQGCHDMPLYDGVTDFHGAMENQLRNKAEKWGLEIPK